MSYDELTFSNLFDNKGLIEPLLLLRFCLI